LTVHQDRQQTFDLFQAFLGRHGSGAPFCSPTLIRIAPVGRPGDV
jgi:hypothetical protein